MMKAGIAVAGFISLARGWGLVFHIGKGRFVTVLRFLQNKKSKVEAPSNDVLGTAICPTTEGGLRGGVSGNGDGLHPGNDRYVCVDGCHRKNIVRNMDVPKKGTLFIVGH